MAQWRNDPAFDALYSDLDLRLVAGLADPSRQDRDAIVFGEVLIAWVLFSQDHCPGHTVYWSKNYDSAPMRLDTLGEFYFPMELDGKKLETTLATSNPMTTLHTDASRKLYKFDSHSTDIETESDAAGNTTAHYRAMKLSGEGPEIINARIQLVDPLSNTTCSLSPRSGAASYDGCFGVHPLKLGKNVIRKLHLYIATKEKVLYFTPANTTTEAPATPAEAAH